MKLSNSKRWLKEHENDQYVKKSREEGYVSRAAYKLLQIQQKEKILKPGMTVVDLGAAPGGWSQVALKTIGKKGRVFALDILPMTPMTGVEFIQGDFTEQTVLDALLERISGDKVDAVISDIAPNMSGKRTIDQPRAIYLVELALECTLQILKKDGIFLVKVFQGEGSEAFLKSLRTYFTKVRVLKPDASRARSREVYMLAKGLKQV